MKTLVETKMLKMSNFSLSPCFLPLWRWLVVSEFNPTSTAKVTSWQSVTHMYFLAFTSASTTFFPKAVTTFLTCFSRGKRQNYTGKKVCLNLVLNSKPPGLESDKLKTAIQVGHYYGQLPTILIKFKIVVFQFERVFNLLF